MEEDMSQSRLVVLALALALMGSSALIGSAPAQALELRTAPETHVYVNVANRQTGQFDAMIQAIGIYNDGDEAIGIESVEIDVIAQGLPILTRRIQPSSFETHTGILARMSGSGRGSMVAAILGNAGGPNGFFGDEVELIPGVHLTGGGATIAARQFLTFDAMPDAIRISARAVHASGEVELVTCELEIVFPDRERAYPLPLEGGWFMTAVPLVTSHHRYVEGTEFAIDFFKSDGEGRIFESDRTDQTDYFGYGEPVKAIAGGRVVRVINGSADDTAIRVHREGESTEAYDERMTERFGNDPELNLIASITGNLVVVEQDDGFFASYGHLAPSSVSVSEGERVETGQVIAAVGGTGEGNMTTHLHIQLNEGPMPLFDQSVPMHFVEDRGQVDTGRIVRSD